MTNLFGKPKVVKNVYLYAWLQFKYRILDNVRCAHIVEMTIFEHI